MPQAPALTPEQTIAKLTQELHDQKAWTMQLRGDIEAELLKYPCPACGRPAKHRCKSPCAILDAGRFYSTPA